MMTWCYNGFIEKAFIHSDSVHYIHLKQKKETDS